MVLSDKGRYLTVNRMIEMYHLFSWFPESVHTLLETDSISYLSSCMYGEAPRGLGQSNLVRLYAVFLIQTFLFLDFKMMLSSSVIIYLML